MSANTERKTVTRSLECGHVRYYGATGAPNVGEIVWCTSCDTGRHVGSQAVNHGRYYEDDFWTDPTDKSNVFDGGCAVEGCEYVEYKVKGWHKLRDNMYRHYLHVHTERGRMMRQTITERLVQHDSDEPPF